MKTPLLIAIVALAAPSVSFADHYYGGHFHGGYWGYGPYYPPYGYYPPPPVVGYAFGPPPYDCPDSRYHGRSASSLESSVQRALHRQGYYSGSVDGDIGPRSRAAIREYQADHRMETTGRIDARLLRSLGI